MPADERDAQVVIYWDIDGTLLTTARAGVRALEDAVEVVLGRSVDLTGLHTAGLTDPMVARAVLNAIGEPTPDEPTERVLLDVYIDRLPTRLREKRGHVMAGVIDVLHNFSQRPDVVLALLTGNMRAGAQAKLRSYGLDSFFVRSLEGSIGGFGDDGYERAEIGRVAVERRRLVLGDLRSGNDFLIGDTPSDIACGQAHSMNVIAVASGSSSVEELSECGPWLALPQLPEPALLADRLGLGAGPAEHEPRETSRT